ncbi:hypothetical protein D6817_01640 [Candidatus Pacearchaeota archaeon]|nr:MAG: hypothetical protein D6817_01640 [Candidatus Pacearchaeota archaeon]
MKTSTKVALLLLAAFIAMLLLSLGVYIYKSVYPGANGNDNSNSAGKRRALPNPAAGKSVEEIASEFNESFVLYLLAQLGAAQLHNPPLSSETPKIEIHVGDDVYSAEIIDGRIIVRRGSIANEDIRVFTTKKEAAKMLLNKSYVRTSFEQGKSSIELVASRTKLVSKGYLSLYSKFG